MPERVAHETAGGRKTPRQEEFWKCQIRGRCWEFTARPHSANQFAGVSSASQPELFWSPSSVCETVRKIYLSDAAAVPWRAELSSEQSPSSHARNKLPCQTDAVCLRCCCASSAPPPPQKNWSCEVKKGGGSVSPSVRPSVSIESVAPRNDAEQRCGRIFHHR